MTKRLTFSNEWRTYRAGGSYDVPKPLADILIRRGFAVVTPKPKAKATRKRKKSSNGNDKKP